MKWIKKQDTWIPGIPKNESSWEEQSQNGSLFDSPMNVLSYKKSETKGLHIDSTNYAMDIWGKENLYLFKTFASSNLGSKRFNIDIDIKRFFKQLTIP